ncbi:hypothetical protein K3495_g5277 [Podosphaera aphanis]|nr:hypothetical protein K3495_g5277 [Podosphaera aphanis]
MDRNGGEYPSQTPNNYTVPSPASQAPGNYTVPSPASQAPGNYPVPSPASQAPGNYPVPSSASQAPGNYPVPSPASQAPSNYPVPSPAPQTPGTYTIPSPAPQTPGTYTVPSPAPQTPDTYAAPPHPTNNMYSQPRPDWAGYAGPPPHNLHPSFALSGAQAPSVSAPVHVRSSQVYSFVPIPGSQQHKRPRRRYEEIERMYKCGYNGCEKAYGTLNHLNAHVTMQSHGQKRTPDEFKEIRKEWKARKKEEENRRKTEEDRNRAGPQPIARPLQLPAIAYQPVNQNQMYTGYPASPYGAAPSQVYNPSNGNNPPNGGDGNGNNGNNSNGGA